MKMVVEPGALRGTLRAIPSKSDAHRHLILASLCDSPTELLMGARSEDIEATIRCLRALGARIEEGADGLLVTPIDGDLRSEAELDAGESGSTLRFMLPLVAALGARAHVVARDGLRARPNAALLGALRAHGARIDGETPPFSLSGQLLPGEYLLPGDVSSQYATGLLMALPMLSGESRIVFTSPVESRGYIDLTVRALSQYGIGVERTDAGYCIPAPKRYVSPGRALVEGDWSNAAFFLAANAMRGDVAVQGLDDHSVQADRVIMDLVEQFKASGDRAVDVSGCPDLVPILAVLATQCVGETRIVNAARLRIKESDRLSAMSQCLRAIGANVVEHEDGLVIAGRQRLREGCVSGHNDHRIVMAMAIAATAADGPIEIDGAEAVNKSYPGFFDDFRRLGGRAHG